MNAQVVDEDSVDSEALQAQIDLSMSFAQNLISSWMEPHKFPRTSRRQNLEQELTEYMKRPPRLGVGASIPEGVQSQTREVARLKGKLAGSKRPRQEDDLDPPKPVSDEEGESRATTIKRKARPDPFDVVHGKKKKKSKAVEVNTLQASISRFSGHVETNKNEQDEKVADTRLDFRPVAASEMAKTSPDSSDEVELALTNPRETDVSPVKIIKNKKEVDKTSEMISPPAKTISSMNTQHMSPLLDTDQGRSETSSENVMSPTKSPTLLKSFTADLLKVPLLNLSGPPSEPESDCDPTTPSMSPKKKRKRRKKKKNNSLSLDSESNPSQRLTPTPKQ